MGSRQPARGIRLGITTVAPYAAFGAFYFLVAAIWLTVSEARRKPAGAAI